MENPCIKLFLCFNFRCKPDTQVTIAGYMSTTYAILMLAVTVGIVVQTSQDSWTSPNAMFIVVITAIFVLAGLLHPEEFMCLMPGVLYFLCIPSGMPICCFKFCYQLGQKWVL
jgi:chitin synthase